jgi:hypothetical protein
MNMLAGKQFDAPRSSPPVDGMVLDFGEKRAGRAVADLQNVNFSAGAYLSTAFLWSRPLWGRVLEGRVGNQTWVDDSPAVFVIAGSFADTTVVAAYEDEDEALVAWFVEQNAAAEQAARDERDEPATDIEWPEDVMLSLRNGSRSTRAWRGGGIMRKR